MWFDITFLSKHMYRTVTNSLQHSENNYCLIKINVWTDVFCVHILVFSCQVIAKATICWFSVFHQRLHLLLLPAFSPLLQFWLVISYKLSAIVLQPNTCHLKQASEPLSKLSAAITRRIQLLETRIKLLKCDFEFCPQFVNNG